MLINYEKNGLRIFSVFLLIGRKKNDKCRVEHNIMHKRGKKYKANYFFFTMDRKTAEPKKARNAVIYAYLGGAIGLFVLSVVVGALWIPKTNPKYEQCEKEFKEKQDDEETKKRRGGGGRGSRGSSGKGKGSSSGSTAAAAAGGAYVGHQAGKNKKPQSWCTFKSHQFTAGLLVAIFASVGVFLLLKFFQLKDQNK